MTDNRTMIKNAREHVREKKYAEALRLFETVLKDNPEATAAYMGIGNIYLKKGDYEEAEEYFNGALHVARASAPPLTMLAVVAEKKGDEARALKLNLDALNEDPRFLKAHINVARLHIRSKQYAEAENHLREALRYNPQSGPISMMLAKVLQRQGKNEQALELLEKMLEVRRPESPEAYLLQGRLLLKSGKFKLAAEAFKNSIKIKPDSVKAKVLLGEALIKSGQFNEAIQVTNSLLLKDPDNLKAKLILSRCYLNNQEYEKAKGILSELANGKRKLSTIHFLLGEVFASQGHYPQALEEFEAGILHADKLLKKYPELEEIRSIEGSIEDKITAYREKISEIRG